MYFLRHLLLSSVHLSDSAQSTNAQSVDQRLNGLRVLRGQERPGHSHGRLRLSHHELLALNTRQVRAVSTPCHVQLAAHTVAHRHQQEQQEAQEAHLFAQRRHTHGAHHDDHVEYERSRRRTIEDAAAVASKQRVSQESADRRH